jgi:hypothetical protein
MTVHMTVHDCAYDCTLLSIWLYMTVRICVCVWMRATGILSGRWKTWTPCCIAFLLPLFERYVRLCGAAVACGLMTTVIATGPYTILPPYKVRDRARLDIGREKQSQRLYELAHEEV